MTIWARLALALALLADRIGQWMEERSRRQDAQRQAAEIERLRNDTVQWWQDNFGTGDVGDDVRLRDAAAERPDQASARDRRG